MIVNPLLETYDYLEKPEIICSLPASDYSHFLSISGVVPSIFATSPILTNRFSILRDYHRLVKIIYTVFNPLSCYSVHHPPSTNFPLYLLTVSIPIR
jgi:hypothetical protein